MKTLALNALFLLTILTPVFPQFSDDFESGNLDNWIIAGRQEGVALSEVVSRYESQMAHLRHDDFSEITLDQFFNYEPDMTFSFDMETFVESDASGTSDFYASAGVRFTFYDAQDNEVGHVFYASLTSSYPVTQNVSNDQYTVNEVSTGTLETYNLTADNLLSQITPSGPVASVRLRFYGYTSGWPYNMAGEVWVDNVSVSENEYTNLDEGLVAYFPFNGNANDESEYGNHGTTHGGISLTDDRFGNENSAFLFDGNDDYIEIDHSSSLNIDEFLSISLWIKMETSGPYYMPYHIIEKGTDWGGGQREDDLNFSVATNDGPFNVWSQDFDYNQYYHFAMIYDGSQIRTYVNGQLKASTIATGNIVTNTESVFISRYYLGGNYYFDGILDDIRIYNRALSESEIAELFHEDGWEGNGQNETDSFVDARDGHIYEIVKIGNQWWMAENLAYLPEVSVSTDGSTSDPRYYVYDYQGTDVAAAKATDYYSTYGVLYNWPAAINSCPAGWRLSSDEDWKEMEVYLGMTQSEADMTDRRGTDEGGKLKEIGTVHWDSPNTGATNEYGFTAIPGGFRRPTSIFDYLGDNAAFWTASEASASNAINRDIDSDNAEIGRIARTKEYGFSVRCVMNTAAEPISITPISDIYNSPVIYKNSRSYFYFNVDQSDGLSYLETARLVQMSSSAGNIPTYLKYLGNGIMQFEVCFDSYPGLSAFDFDLPSQLIDVFGTTINFLVQPTSKSFDLVEPEVEQEIDIFAGGSLGAKLTAGSVGLGPSISAAAVSATGSAGMGMTFTRKMNGDQFISRRLEVGVAAQAKAPELNAVVGNVDIFSVSAGLSGTAEQRMRFPASENSDLMLKAKAYNVLETFSLGGVELSPITGMFIMALRKALLEYNPDLQQIYQDLNYSTSLGVAKEFSGAIELSLKLLDNDNCKLSAGEASVNTSFGLGVEVNHQNDHRNFDLTLAGGFDAGLLNFEFFNFEVGSILGAEKGCEIKIEADFVKGDGFNSLGLGFKTTTTGSISLLDFSIWNSFKFDIPKAVISRNLQSDNIVGLVSPFVNSSYNNQSVSLRPGRIVEYLHNYINDTPIELLNLDEYVRFSHDQANMFGTSANLKIDLTVALGIGAGLKMGIEYSYFDELKYPLKQYAIVESKLLPVYEFKGLSEEDRLFTFEDEMYDLLYGTTLLIEDPLRELEQKIEEIIEAGRAFTIVAFSHSVKMVGTLSTGGNFILSKISSSIKRTKKSAFMESVVINAYTSQKVVPQDDSKKSTDEPSTLYIVSDHFDATLLNESQEIVEEFDPVNMSIAVNMDLVNELEFSENDLHFARMYYYDFDSLCWFEQAGDINPANDTVETQISKSGTYAVGINFDASMDDDPVEITDYYPANLQTIHSRDTVWVELKESIVGSGIDFVKTQILIDGTPVEAEWHPVTGILKYVPVEQFENGEHSFSANVFDNSGNYSNVFSVFKVQTTNLDYSIAMKDVSFSCYPNPATEVVYISVNNPGGKEHAEISIFNAKGELISILFEGEIQAGQSTFELGRTAKNGVYLKQGVYFIRYKNEKDAVVKKVVFK